MAGPSPTKLPFEPIAAYERLLETRDFAVFRAFWPNKTTLDFYTFQTELRLTGLQDVALLVESIQIEGRTAEARIRRRDTFEINGKRQVRTVAQPWRFEKTDAAGIWRVTGFPLVFDIMPGAGPRDGNR